MTSVRVLFALFGVFMLFRNLPGLRALLRGEARPRAMGVVSALNVLLALMILGVAVKGLVDGLISR